MAERPNEELCTLAAEGDADAFELLLKRNEGFLREQAAWAWRGISFSDVDLSLEYEDMYQIAAIAFWEAAKEYDSVKGAQFITYAGTVIRSRLLDVLKKAYSDRGRAGVFVRLDQKPRDENPPEIEEPYIRHFQKYPDVAFFQKEQRRVTRDAINRLSPRERIFILHRFGFVDGEPLTMTEACRQFSLTEMTAKDLEASALRSIRREYEKNYKVMVAKLLDVERFLREDEGFYIPFVPPSVCGNLPFTSTLDDKTPDE